MAQLTDAQVALLRSTSFGAVATLKKDGTPQTSIVWVDTDGEHVVFNTRNDRAKARNLRRDPRVSVSVFDGDSHYRYFEVEGLAELVDDGANEHIHQLSRKYNGTDFHTPENRVIVRVRAERIFDYQVSE